jgi:hypothetical protein
MISGPLRYYAPIQGHELVPRRDLIPSEPDHPRAGQWYYKLQLGPLEHKIPPIVSARWRRVTFIVATGGRFMNAHEINDLFEQESPVGQLYMRLKELGIAVEREWWIDEQGIAYIVDLALPYENGWLPVSFGDRPGPAGGLRFAAEEGPDACLWDVPSSEAKRDCPPGQAGVANARRQAPAPNPTIKTNHPPTQVYLFLPSP